MNIVRPWRYARAALYEASQAFVEYVAHRLSQENYLVLNTSYDVGYRHRLAPDLLVVNTQTRIHCYLECKSPTKYNPVCELRELMYQRQLPAPVVVACLLPNGSEIGFLLDEPADRVYVPGFIPDAQYRRIKAFAEAEAAHIYRFRPQITDRGSSLPFAWWDARRWSGQNWLDVVRLVLTEGVER